MSDRIEFRIAPEEYQEIVILAKKMNLSANSYAKKLLMETIKKQENFSPTEFINPHKLMVAQKALIQLNKNITELPNTCGKDRKESLKKGVEKIWDTLSW